MHCGSSENLRSRTPTQQPACERVSASSLLLQPHPGQCSGPLAFEFDDRAVLNSDARFALSWRLAHHPG